MLIKYPIDTIIAFDILTRNESMTDHITTDILAAYMYTKAHLVSLSWAYTPDELTNQLMKDGLYSMLLLTTLYGLD